MPETAKVLKRAQVNIPFIAQITKGPVRQGQRCCVISFKLFDSREACDMCDRPHQADRQVMVMTDSGTVPAGLTCLHQLSGITAARVEKEVDGQVGLAVRVRHILKRDPRTAPALPFEDTEDTLQQLQQASSEILAGTRHGAAILAEMSDISQRLETQDIRASDLNRLQMFTDHLAYLLDARDQPERHQARVQALLEDPLPDSLPLVRGLERLPLDQPQDLSPEDVRRVKETMRKLTSMQPTKLLTPEVDPGDFESEALYHGALDDYYYAEAVAGRELRGNLQGQYDLVHFYPERQPIHPLDVLEHINLPCVLPIYNHPAIERLYLDSKAVARMLATRHGHSVNTRGHGRTHLLKIRTDKLEKRLGDDGKERRPSNKKQREIPCWFLAIWRPDPWHRVYVTWRQHGGRARLLTFPTTN